MTELERMAHTLEHMRVMHQGEVVRTTTQHQLTRTPTVADTMSDEDIDIILTMEAEDFHR